MENFRRRFFGTLVFAILSAVNPSSPAAESAEVLVTVSVDTTSVTAGSPAVFWLNALNTSDRPISWSFPQELSGRHISNGGSSIFAQLHDSVDSRVTTIAPGSFVRREYAWTVPLTLRGEVTVEISEVPGTRMVFEVDPPPPPVAPGEEQDGKGLIYFLKGRKHAKEAARYDPDDFFKEHIFGYEPFYFIAGTASPNAKFQFSFKYRLFNDHGMLVRRMPWLTGVYFAFTQTSLWDLSGPSAPFFDSSYKPEFFYGRERLIGRDPTSWFRLDLQGGYQHESNGKENSDSRSLNIVYLKPTLVFGRDTGPQLSLMPRVWGYVADLDDNPDMVDYRGYGDLRAIFGWKRGLQISALARMGKRGDHKGLQVDVTYPMMQPPSGSFSVYLHAQYFTGYGESLIGYKEKTQSFRAGISLYR